MAPLPNPLPVAPTDTPLTTHLLPVQTPVLPPSTATLTPPNNQIPDHLGLERYVQLYIHPDLWVEVAEAPCDLGELTPGERRAYHGVAHTPKAKDWRIGRTALKALLKRMNRYPDTSKLTFPVSWVSLTHHGGVAVALGMSTVNQFVLQEAALQGCGVDYQPITPMQLESVRFFLSPREQSQWRELSLEDQERHIVRLWSLKEALYKADPENHTGWFSEWEVDDVTALHGQALRKEKEPSVGNPKTFSYFTVPWREGWLSIAILPGPLAQQVGGE